MAFKRPFIAGLLLALPFAAHADENLFGYVTGADTLFGAAGWW